MQAQFSRFIGFDLAAATTIATKGRTARDAKNKGGGQLQATPPPSTRVVVSEAAPLPTLSNPGPPTQQPGELKRV
eukprot:8254047-Pyramimonas_sp.AAC.1